VLGLVQFVKNYISQGSGGIFNDILSQIFKESGSEKNLQNPLKIDKLMNMTWYTTFWDKVYKDGPKSNPPASPNID